MTETLQKKFVFTSMTAITILLCVLLIVINAGNAIFVNRQINDNIKLVLENEGGMRDIKELPAPIPQEKRRFEPKNERDRFLSQTFFTVKTDINGQTVFVDVTRTSSVSQSFASELAEKCVTKKSQNGFSGKYRYMSSSSEKTGETTFVFLDISEEIISCLRILLLSLAVGTAADLAMLPFVKFLSKKVIKPIAENIDKQKQFVTNAGHEIKTPLAVILANTEAMELYNGETKWSKNIRTQTERLSELMKNLLALAKADEAANNTVFENFNLSDLISDSIGLFEENFRIKNIDVKTEINSDIHINADKSQIEQLVSILTDNASKYTDENGSFSVSLKKDGKKTELCFKNTCETLPSSKPETLFERFYRADEAHTQKTGGCGIGLSVAKSIVEANKGKIKAEYELPNTVKFIITF